MTTPPADRLRTAATLLRDRATAATPPADPNPGGWAGHSLTPRDGWPGTGSAIYGGPADNGYRTATVMSTDETCDTCQAPSPADVAYICTVHPGVGLALAELLGKLAAAIENAAELGESDATTAGTPTNGNRWHNRNQPWTWANWVAEVGPHNLFVRMDDNLVRIGAAA